jgi:hypothetical protein
MLSSYSVDLEADKSLSEWGFKLSVTPYSTFKNFTVSQNTKNATVALEDYDELDGYISEIIKFDNAEHYLLQFHEDTETEEGYDFLAVYSSENELLYVRSGPKGSWSDVVVTLKAFLGSSL